jgi:thiamine phosphate synthase YjbQ (UPF0047 family)
MQTTASTFVYRHTRLGILTERAADVVDLTDGLGCLLTDADLTTGVVNLRSLAAGTGILVTESAGPFPPGEASTGHGACLSIVDGRLQLAASERVLLFDAAGPGAREVAIVMIGERRR